MTASDFQINFPFGATSAPYSAAHPHRGDDRACPTGTMVVVAGTTIGLTGHSGLVIGPSGVVGAADGAHLHIQEWQGDPSNCRQPQNAFQPGTVTAATSSSDFGNYITITTADGWNDSYCHLSQINVTVGQVIGEAMTKNEAYTVVDGYYRWGTGVPPTPEQSEYWADRLSTVPTGNQELYETMKKSAATQKPTNYIPYSGSPLFTEKK